MPAAAALLLPASEGFDVGGFDPRLRQGLGRADRLPDGEPGRRAQINRWLQIIPAHWPLAAIARKQECNDAEGACWLRADPVHVRPDINGARLLGWGEGLQLTLEDTQTLQAALRPLFGEAGFHLDASLPWHWYLRLPEGARLPATIDPAEALGTDLGDVIDTSPEGRRWRALESEAQVIMHNHPLNVARRARGLPAVNSIWFWGGGAPPHAVQARDGCQIASRDPSVHVLAREAQVWQLLPPSWDTPDRDTAFDLNRVVRSADIASDWMLPALDALHEGKLRSLRLDFADGLQFQLERKQRWRLFRKPIASLS